jgi:hypothetical protein
VYGASAAVMLVMLWGSRYALAVVSAGYGGLVAVLAVGSPSAYVVGALLALAEQERLYFTYRCADRPPLDMYSIQLQCKPIASTAYDRQRDIAVRADGPCALLAIALTTRSLSARCSLC